MRVLLFDTETTGLPKYRRSAKDMKNNWPHIVSLSWIVLENDVIVDKQSYIVKPTHWAIPPSSTAIHGITQEQAMREGLELQEVINKFMYEPYDLLVAHNLEFDENVLVNAIYWDLGNDKFDEFPHPKRCSMVYSRSICKLPGYSIGYKNPTLSELYKHVFGVLPNKSQLHNSLYDVEILTNIIQTCKELRESIGLVPSNSQKDNVSQTKQNILRI